MTLEKSTRKPPEPQKVLNGEIGLTSIDIARGLNVSIEAVHQKIKRNKWTVNEDWKPIAYTMIQDNNRLDTYYCFTLEGAKAFLARWVNHKGDEYLKEIFDFEKRAIIKIKGLQESLVMAQKQIEALTAPKIKRTKRKKTVVRIVTKTVKGLFGDIVETEEVRENYDEMDDTSRRQFTFQHCLKVMEGLSRRMNSFIEQGLVSVESTNKALPPKKTRPDLKLIE